MEVLATSVVWIVFIAAVMLRKDSRQSIHRWTAPAPLPDVRIGDIWVHANDHPWQKGLEVLDIKDGWVKFKNGRDEIHTGTLRWFVEGMKLKSRASS